MDDRTLSWIHLLPRDARFLPSPLPDELLALLGHRIDQTGNIWLGWHASPGDLPPLSGLEAVVLLEPCGVTPEWLRSKGLGHIRSFAVLPHFGDARWFVPLEHRRASLRAWDLYVPYHRRARLRKLLMRLLSSMGASGYFGRRVVLAQRHLSPLEQALARAVGTQHFSLAVAAGTPGPRRKLTMQVATEQGEVLAYVKYADRAETGTLLEQEAQFLQFVGTLGLRTAAVPDLLYHGSQGDGYVMVTVPVRSSVKPSGTVLAAPHMATLAEMGEYIGTSSTAELLAQLRARIHALTPSLSTSWVERFKAALALVQTLPDLDALPTTLSHGDFAPWNLRIERRGNRLLMFDWEQGQTDQFMLWDAFHFVSQVHILINRRRADTDMGAALATVTHSRLSRQHALSSSQVHGLYVIYLMDSSVQWFETQRTRPGMQWTLTAEQEMRGRMLDTAATLLRTVSAAACSASADGTSLSLEAQ